MFHLKHCRKHKNVNDTSGTLPSAVADTQRGRVLELTITEHLSFDRMTGCRITFTIIGEYPQDAMSELCTSCFSLHDVQRLLRFGR